MITLSPLSEGTFVMFFNLDETRFEFIIKAESRDEAEAISKEIIKVPVELALRHAGVDCVIMRYASSAQTGA